MDFGALSVVDREKRELPAKEGLPFLSPLFFLNIFLNCEYAAPGAASTETELYFAADPAMD